MADHDVFDRHVPRRFRSAARQLLLGRRNDPDALQAVLQAMTKKLRVEGCPGFCEIVDIVAEMLAQDDRQRARQPAVEQLEELRLIYGCSTTELAVQAAKHYLAGPGSTCGGGATSKEDEVKIEVAAHLLAGLADAWLCPAPLVAELIEADKLSWQDLHARRERLKFLLVVAPETTRLAGQLLADSSGASVALPRPRRAKLSQAEILVTALTA